MFKQLLLAQRQYRQISALGRRRHAYCQSGLFSASVGSLAHSRTASKRPLCIGRQSYSARLPHRQQQLQPPQRQRHDQSGGEGEGEGEGGSANKACWHCQQQNSPASLLCKNEKCAVIQAVGKGVNYYDVLLAGRPPSFEIDAAELRRNFLRSQQAVHPDSFSQRGQIERRLAEVQSSWINHAYATLKDPLHRAQYLLKLRGMEIGEADQIADPELLMEIMDTREEIEEATTDAQIAAIKARNDANIAAVTTGLASAFGSDALSRARQLTNRLQYLRRVAQAVHVWEPGKPVVISH
ncbi:molecular chaperone [Kickxella alabastrina]|uniref:Molecular chaperone n=1 Tax=Kickxella alabastrina TaxID=61397 RepID=A0ACC1IR59_9FUNG|nr:molecular chaperone [Kickxella alabastrina]